MEWISVRESLPDNGRTVLVGVWDPFLRKMGHEIARYEATDKRWIRANKKGRVLYWMDFPPFPEEVEF